MKLFFKIPVGVTILLTVALNLGTQRIARGFNLSLVDSIIGGNTGSQPPTANEAEFLFQIGLNAGESVQLGDVLYIKYTPWIQGTLGFPASGGIFDNNPRIDREPSNLCGPNGSAECARGIFTTETPIVVPAGTSSNGDPLIQLVFPFPASAFAPIPYEPTTPVNLGYFRTLSFAKVISSNPPPYAYFGPFIAELRDSSGNLRYSSSTGGGNSGNKKVFDANKVKPVPPKPGPLIPRPLQVPGKEYSNQPDINEDGVPMTEQTFLWDGDGGVKNGFNYGGSGEVDAIANINDTLFKSLIKNESALLFSTTGDKPAPILFESISGTGIIWAIAAEINNQGVNELDGLEVWGPGEDPNANQYSLVGDPNGVAVFSYTVGGGSFEFTVSELATAIGLPQDFWNQFDLDALMVNGEEILFSIAPVWDFDGGEIWYWNKSQAGNAQFLDHGGHLWNTEFDIRGTFGTTSENIDALEAVSTVPEASSLFGYLALGTLGAASTLKRKLKPSKSSEKETTKVS